MINRPLVSVVIPAYKAAQFIEETIKSVINQSYTNLECIVVDDGSPDELGEIVKKLEYSDSRITYSKQENAGVSLARNHGFKLSKGELICFLDADDLFEPNRLESMIELFHESGDSVGLIHSDMAYINESSELTGEIGSGMSGSVLDDLLLWEKCVIPAPSSIMVKRDVIQDVGLFNIELSNSADFEFFTRVANKYLVLRIPKVLGKYRVHENNMSKNIKLLESDQIKAYKIAMQKGLFKSNTFKQKCFSNMYLIIGASHWKDANDYFNGAYFIIKGIITYPPHLFKVIKKTVKIIK